MKMQQKSVINSTRDQIIARITKDIQELNKSSEMLAIIGDKDEANNQSIIVQNLSKILLSGDIPDEYTSPLTDETYAIVRNEPLLPITRGVLDQIRQDINVLRQSIKSATEASNNQELLDIIDKDLEHQKELINLLESLLKLRPIPESYQSPITGLKYKYSAKETLITNFSSSDDEPTTAVDFFNRGCFEAASGNNLLAMQAFENAICLDDKLAAAYNNRACLYMAINNNLKALNDFNKAIELNDNFAIALYNRSCLYYLLDNRDLANADRDKVKQYSLTMRDIIELDSKSAQRGRLLTTSISNDSSWNPQQEQVLSIDILDDLFTNLSINNGTGSSSSVNNSSGFYSSNSAKRRKEHPNNDVDEDDHSNTKRTKLSNSPE